MDSSLQEAFLALAVVPSGSQLSRCKNKLRASGRHFLSRKSAIVAGTSIGSRDGSQDSSTVVAASSCIEC